MRIAGVVGLSLIMGFGFVACSSGGAGMLNDAGSGTSANDGDAERDATSSRDAAMKDALAKDAKADAVRTDARKAVCVLNCQTDSECEATCPAALNGGANCCDTASGVCYASSAGSCGAVDAGVD